MAIVQDTFDIPDDIMNGLTTGMLQRCGGVVRQAAGTHGGGQIVAHLKPLDLQSSEETMGSGKAVLQAISQHPKGVIAGAIGIIVIGASAAYYKFRKKKSKAVDEFNTALRQYIEAIRKGSMSTECINNLLEKLEKLKKQKNYKKINIQLTADEMGALVERIYRYTIKLAQDNDVELDANGLAAKDTHDGNIIYNLENYLRAQKRIFAEAA